MMLNRRYFVMGAITLGLSLAGALSAKPNFTGDWKLNVDKSEFGPFPPPTSMTMKIEHADPDMKVASSQSGQQGDISYDAKYSTDGKETANTIGPMEMKSTAVWEADDLIVTTKFEANGAEIVIKSKWTLSQEGKVLTQNAHITGPQGDVDVAYVMDKQ
jgi:hypothetical protein